MDKTTNITIPCTTNLQDVSAVPAVLVALQVYVASDDSLTSDIVYLATWFSYTIVLLLIDLPSRNLKLFKGNNEINLNIDLVTLTDSCYTKSNMNGHGRKMAKVKWLTEL